MTTRELLFSTWGGSAAVPALAVLALVGYGARLRSRRALFFVAGVSLFYLALASPLGFLARGYLFSAHMLQHLLLLLAVPPLLLAGFAPRPPSLSARPRSDGLAVLPWVAGVGAMWIWHARALCNAAAESAGVQWLQTTSLVGLGLWFWWPILAPRPGDRLPAFAAILYLFAACAACTLLGILVTFSSFEVCSAYLHPADARGLLPLLRKGWGLTPGVDQQIGGLLMWLPACLLYAGFILGILARYYRDEAAAAGIAGSGTVEEAR